MYITLLLAICIFSDSSTFVDENTEFTTYATTVRLQILDGFAFLCNMDYPGMEGRTPWYGNLSIIYFDLKIALIARPKPLICVIQNMSRQLILNLYISLVKKEDVLPFFGQYNSITQVHRMMYLDSGCVIQCQICLICLI